ncbi:MAG: hypothetical protein KJO42_10860 [Silicimonas sp.]|nr:hypothetical protein [Silicimonas sp.]
MLNLVKSFFGVPTPSGPTETLAEFRPGTDQPLDGAAKVDDAAWKLTVDGARSVPLFKFPVPDETEGCRLHYRMQLKTGLQSGFAYLEMWCDLPGMGKFFSKGLHDKISGTTDWTDHEVPFLLKKGQRPDELDLNLYVEGKGTVWIRSISVLKTPLA